MSYFKDIDGGRYTSELRALIYTLRATAYRAGVHETQSDHKGFDVAYFRAVLAVSDYLTEHQL